MTQRVGAVTGAGVDDVLAVFLARALPVPPERAALLGRWQAFSTLWRQQWHPAPREDRRLRWAVAIFSVLVNLFFAAALVWLMYLQFLGLEPPPQGETVVQVEFVGQGTPGEIGGGDAPPQPAAQTETQTADRPTPASEAAAAANPEAEAVSESTESQPVLPQAALETRVESPELAGQPLDVPEREVAAPSVPAAPQEQVVAVSEPTPDRTDVFVLPPPRAAQATPRVPARELRATVPQIRETEVSAPVSVPTRTLDPAAPTVRPLIARTPQVVEREVAVPVQAPTAREVAVRTPAVRELTPKTQEVREREVQAPRAAPAPVPTPVRAPATTAATAVTTSRASAPTSASPTTGSSSTTPSQSRPAAPSSSAGTATASAPSPASSQGTGPKAQPTPGSWATPARADDWGASARNTPGAQRGVAPGVFNADGSVRVPEGPGSAAPGMPPGAVTQEIANLDRAGTWLKRKPTDFEPTSFDKYWVPNESLLAEWVRKSIKEVLIPIPGTNKRIRCAVALLALGGACGITDPNLNEQPASARPPPPVPFKPHLQEDNGSVKPGTPPGG